MWCTVAFNHTYYFYLQEQHEVLEGMFKRMSTLFSDMAKYYAFDPKKYTLDEFMGDIKTFIEQFKVCWKNIDFRFFPFYSIHLKTKKYL